MDLQQMYAQFAAYVPNLVGALAILLLGFLVAYVLSALVKAALSRTSIDNKLAHYLSESKKPAEVENAISTIVFYVLMVFVAVAFLQALGLTLLVQPLNNLLDKLLQFIPKALGAGVLLLVAWGLATIVHLAVKRAVETLKLEQRLETEPPKPDAKSVAATVADVMYWLVFLLFLPAIVDALGMSGVLQPIQHMVDRFLAFLPNLFGAAVTLLVGWFVARVVQRLATSFLSAAGMDACATRFGLDTVLAPRKLSEVAGLVLNMLILLPVLVAALDALGLDNVTKPVSGMLAKILIALPNLFAAFLVMALTYFIGKAVGNAVTNTLTAVGFNTFLGNLGLMKSDAASTDTTGSTRTPAHLVGTLVFVTALLLASVEACRLLSFEALALMISGFMEFAGHILVGLALFVIGLYLANIAGGIVASSSSPNAKFLAILTRAAVVILVAAMALRQTNLANEIINLAFGLLLGSIAVAVALSFGLGGRDVAGKALANWAEKLEDKKA